MERFLAKVARDPSTGCWMWKGYVRPGSYALIAIGKKRVFAHRIAWRLFRGEIPEGMRVCHQCDVYGCVNPDHLFLGTPAENSSDMKRKGRSCQGEKHFNAKLNDEKVRAIRALLARGERIRVIAASFGVSRTTIEHIKNGLIWRHVQPRDAEQIAVQQDRD